MQTKILRIAVEAALQPKSNNPTLVVYLWIDGVRWPPSSKSRVDLMALRESLRGGGPFYPFTCSCDEPSCGGWMTPTQISHDDSLIRWVIPGLPGGGSRSFSFSAEQYRGGIESAITKGKALARRNDVKHGCNEPPQNANLLLDTNLIDRRAWWSDRCRERARMHPETDDWVPD